MSNLILETRALSKQYEFDGGRDWFDCAVCKSVRYDLKIRYCWRDEGRREVLFKNCPPLLLTRRELCATLPRRNPVAYLLSGAVRIHGRKPCPIALSESCPEVGLFLDWQTDMTGGDGGWHAMPLAGPIETWPSYVVKILRHIRGVNSRIQFEDSKRMFGTNREDKEQDAPPDGTVERIT